MTVKEINTEALALKLRGQLDEIKRTYYSKVEEARKEIIDCEDKTKIMECVEYFMYINEKYENSLNDNRLTRYINAAKLFNKMSRELTREFDTTEVDTEAHTIRFPWFGNTLSFPLKMLASRYNLHPGMFGFESSFTTHDAYTEDNFAIRIGIDSDDTVIRIDFGAMDLH